MMATKRKYWSDYVTKCVQERRHFALINLLARRGKMWVNYMPICNSRERRPTIVDNVDHTQTVWRDYYNSQFCRDNLQPAAHLNGLVEAEPAQPITYNVTTQDVLDVLKTKRSRSSPGPSGLRYAHWKFVAKARPD